MANSFITDSTPAGDFEKLTVGSAAAGFTASKLLIPKAGGYFKRAVRAFITVETQSIRVRFDGTDPDTSTGHLLAAGDFMTLEGESNVSKARLIRATGSDGTAQVTYFYIH